MRATKAFLKPRLRPVPRSRSAFLGGAVAWALVSVATCRIPAADVEVKTDPFAATVRPLLERYCMHCHGAERTRGGVDFSRFEDSGGVRLDPKLWEAVTVVLRDLAMPPARRKPQPSLDEREEIIRGIEAVLEMPGEGGSPVLDPGRTVIRRLTRDEYDRTVQDLFGADWRPAEGFPADGGGGEGFDNNADTLFVPPILLEKYLAAAHEIVDRADPELLFFVEPGADLGAREAAARIVRHFGGRAFRRPLREDEVDRYASLVERSIARGAAYESGVRLALKAMLISPQFLFRVEADRESDAPWLVSDFELAARLSYFLWSSIPDFELRGLAESGRLHEPEVLAAEARRMLADPRARAFYDGFIGQWLGVRTLRTASGPDPRRFPQYTTALRESMIEEPIETFARIVREGRSLLELLDSGTVVVDAELAAHYGLPRIDGPGWYRVETEDCRRGGVVGMAGILTLTSYPRRTSPVLRGKWVLEELLGTPLPPPPPNAGGLPADDAPREGLTFRERLEKHREKPECAGCHARMDPVGFGLEVFDPIGRLRDEIGGAPIDASGKLVSGEEFRGPFELKSLLLERQDDFLEHATEKLLAYALGREVGYRDAATMREITAATRARGYRADTWILEVVQSYPFRYRRGPDRDAVVSTVDGEALEALEATGRKPEPGERADLAEQPSP